MDNLARIERWREVCPDITLRSTFIVGFPGETEEEFEELLDFLRAARLDRVGAFAYSPVKGAAANALPDAVPEAIKQQRLARFMEVQKKISSEKLQQRIGRILTVLVDEVRGNQAVARSSADAPDIDGVVYLDTAQGLNPGDLTRVKITDADAHDLWARPA